MSPAEVAAVTRPRLAAELDQARAGLRLLASAFERLQRRTDDPDRIRATEATIARPPTGVSRLASVPTSARQGA